MSVLSMEELRRLSQYDHFASVWREIDDGRLNALQNNQDLPLLINDKQKGVTPLFLAIKRKQIEMVLLLLANGADPNIICKDASPLWLACFLGLTEIVYPLLDNGADPNCICNGASPLHVSAARGLVEICEIICSFPRGVDVNVCTDRLGTAMHVAISKGHKYVMDCLMKYNPDLSLRNRFGETPLHIACRSEDESIALHLISSNLPMDPFIKDNVLGATVAHSTNSIKVFRGLLSKWPQLLHALDDYGRTPTFYMPGEALALFTSITSKVAQHSGEHLLDDVARYGDIYLVCPVFVSKLPATSGTTGASTTTTKEPSSPASVESLTAELHNASIPVPTENILCHKAVLYARSEYFKNQLQSTAMIFEPAASDTKLEPSLLSIPSCPRSLLADVLAAAKLFQIPRLRELVQGKLGKDVELSDSTHSADFLKMHVDALFADVQVHLPSKDPKLPGKSYRLHRFMLAAFSEYFQTMFTAGLRETRTGIVELHHMDALTFEAYLHWIYSFTIRPTIKTLAQCFSLLELSSTFISPDLSLPLQTKILTQLVSTQWAHLEVAILESDRLSAHIVYEQCAVYFGWKLKDHTALRNKLPADVLERLEKMAAPRVEKPFTSRFVSAAPGGKQ